MRARAMILLLGASACAASQAVTLPPLPADEGAPRDACAAADVDLDLLFAKLGPCVERGAPADVALDPATKEALRVEMTPSRASVAAGGRVDFALTLTNVGPSPLTIVLVGDLSLAPYVFDARQLRVSPPPDAPPRGDDCEPEPPPLRARVALPPGGRAHARPRWEATREQWTVPADECLPPTIAAAGPLAPGAYELVFPIPFADKAHAPPLPRAAVEVVP